MKTQAERRTPERKARAANETAGVVALFGMGILSLALFAHAAWRLTAGQGGVPLDDAWIHFQFARNLARGNGWSFNPGQPTSGSTAPLWTILLATLYFVGGDFPIAGQAASAIGYLGTVGMTYALGRRLVADRRWPAWLAAAIVALNGRMVWAGLSALETCLFTALSLAAIRSYLRDRDDGHYRLRTAAMFGLAALSRPEGYLLFALSIVLWIIAPLPRCPQPGFPPPAVGDSGGYRQRQRPSLPLPLSLLAVLVTFAAIVAPYLWFSFRTSGHWLPNTYHAKATVGLRPDMDFLSVAARYLILDNPLLLPFYVLGIGFLMRSAPLLSLWSVGLPLAYAFLHATLYQHGRYLMPLIPVNALIGVTGLAWFPVWARKQSRTAWARRVTAIWQVPWSRWALLAALLLGTAWRLPTMCGQYARNVREINQMHVAIGRWAAEHTPTDSVLALNDIGAIGYISQRPVFDLAGLVTPEVTPILHAPESERTDRLIALMAAQDVAYVIIFPTWFPDLTAHEERLEEVYRITLTERTIAGGNTMVVYRFISSP